MGSVPHPLLIPAQGNHHVQLPSFYYSGSGGRKKGKKKKKGVSKKRPKNELKYKIMANLDIHTKTDIYWI